MKKLILAVFTVAAMGVAILAPHLPSDASVFSVSEQ